MKKTVEENRADLAADVESYLARGGEIKKMRDCSPKESWYRSNKLYKDLNNPNRTYRKLPKKPYDPLVTPMVFSGYNSGKK